MSALFEKNRAVLRKRHPALERLVSNHVDLIKDARPWQEPSAFSESPVLAAREALRQEADFLYWRGTGNGRELIEAISPFVRGNRGVMVIEPSPARFAGALFHHDLSPVFRSAKIFWAVGEDADTQAQNLMDATLCHAAARPRFIVHPGRADAPGAAASKRAIEAAIAEKNRRLRAEIESFPQRAREALSRRAPRVWSFEDLRGKQRYSLIQHALVRALFYHLRSLGCETRLAALDDNRYYPPFYRIVDLVRFRPNAVFLCNQAPAFEFALGEAFARSLPIPKAVWCADDPAYAEHLWARHGVADGETCFAADYEWSDTLLRHGAAEVIHLPGAVTRTRRGKKRGRRKCDAVFVGQVRDQEAFFAKLSPAWRDYAERVIGEKLRFPRKRLSDIFRQIPLPAPVEADYFDELKQKLLWEANSRFRAGIVRRLLALGMDIHIYGNEAWRKWLPAKAAGRCFKSVAPRRALFEIYRNAAITLNIHSLQTHTCLNVRDFDVPAAGGFLISDWLPRADEVFAPGFVSDLPLAADSSIEAFFYRSPAELDTLARYFIERPDERALCVERARRKVLAEHTYAQRAARLCAHFNEALRLARERHGL